MVLKKKNFFFLPLGGLRILQNGGISKAPFLFPSFILYYKRNKATSKIFLIPNNILYLLFMSSILPEPIHSFIISLLFSSRTNSSNFEVGELPGSNLYSCQFVKLFVKIKDLTLLSPIIFNFLPNTFNIFSKFAFFLFCLFGIQNSHLYKFIYGHIKYSN
jgi:hypothetical protein